MRPIHFLTTLAVAALALSGRPSWADDPAPAPQNPAPANSAPKPPAPVVTVPTFENATCPIMGRPSSKVLFTDTEKGRIYVCCPPCIPKIKADSARAYAAAYPTLKKAGNAVCPVTGDKIEGEAIAVVLQGYEISLCCKDCVKKAQANSQIVLTKVLKPNVVDLGNLTSPVSGKAVADNVFVLVDNDLIHLAAASEIEEVKRDPEKARKAAKDIVAKQQAEAKAKEAPADKPAEKPHESPHHR
jgi:hypothetical protein